MQQAIAFQHWQPNDVIITIKLGGVQLNKAIAPVPAGRTGISFMVVVERHRLGPMLHFRSSRLDQFLKVVNHD